MPRAFTSQRAMTTEWYTTVDAEDRVMQGDLIRDCPVLRWESIGYEGELGVERLQGMANAVEADVVVLTQSCDLENDKVANVVLCPHLGIGEFKKIWEEAMRLNSQNPTQRAWSKYCDQICDGQIWNLSIVNGRIAEELGLEPRIVDFHEVYSIPRLFLEQLLLQRGDARLRLLPPYREHLSQAFARFFMRVGLPSPVDRSW